MRSVYCYGAASHFCGGGGRGESNLGQWLDQQTLTVLCPGISAPFLFVWLVFGGFLFVLFFFVCFLQA